VDKTHQGKHQKERKKKKKKKKKPDLIAHFKRLQGLNNTGHVNAAVLLSDELLEEGVSEGLGNVFHWEVVQLDPVGGSQTSGVGGEGVLPGRGLQNPAKSN